MGTKKIFQSFFLPSLTSRFFIRVFLVAFSAYLFFNYLLIPVHINGLSMEPTYRDGSFNFTWRLHYLLSEPKRFDVVTVRFAGKRVMLLKRVVALEGEEIEFRDGKLFVNGEAIHEPYISYPCNWNLSPRRVKEGHLYVVGDNRNMPLKQHTFGQTPLKRILGGPLW